MEKRLRETILNNKSRFKNISAKELEPLLLKRRIFTISMMNDICNNGYDLFDELLSRGPGAFTDFIEVLKESGYTEEAKILDINVSKISNRLCYKIQSDPLGMCLIINNVNFTEQKERLGSDVDAANLFKIFEKIGFLVLPERNLTAKQMENRLMEFSVDERWKLVDSCIVIIMSHGRSIDNLDVVYGTDGEYLSKYGIIHMFDNLHSVNLFGKPKIFIFQSCRGDYEDFGVDYPDTHESTDAHEIIMPDHLRKRDSSMADILVVHSALPYHRSYRDHEKGSWLCQDLVEVLSKDYVNTDLETILKSVTRKIRNRLSIDGNRKQGIHLEPINLCADIYFNRNIMCEYFKI